ncbi:transcriptional regulator, AsnC family [Mesorhizobium albiziae]|uniref:Transcriptional regulator, AsnC family n=1 Tax=Neomesorhizobium albiziae TaxID=335020 RepID=A0A1I3UZ17_9HYPH|nr:Lrp/AsnC family transcriptional regulator [Mesorhizobium albiziae]GLS28549.1 AsnC family transcriptional regulator [Mesorhizobium albiziae]SFJ88130.1 transcriptional regulator, AsnC family [Mesorhizobium albiziae]
MAEVAVDETDLRILKALQRDGRLSNVELAEAVNLSPSPCLRRTKRMQEEGVIRGYRVDIDRNAVELGLTVFVGFKVLQHTRENADRLSAALDEIPEVVSCFMVSGEDDFLAEVVVKDLAAYERLLSERLLTLPMVAGIRSNFALRSIKTAAPLPL